MAFIDDETLNKIRKESDIVDVIGGYIDLVPKGKNFFGVCPFHDDHSPSMSVSPDKQIYRCFTCGASGNVFTFVTNYENISFYDAVVKLGEKIGIKLEKKNKIKKINQYENLYNLYELSVNFYKNNLNSIAGEQARDYLKSRKIDEDMIKRFDIGLSVSGGLSKVLKDKCSPEDLVDIGLSYMSDNEVLDLYRNRIMFPIKDMEGNVVAYSGRKYDGSDGPKYINTKGTKIFIKGKTLYNYSDAIDEIRKKKEIIIVEGFMEVIRLYSIGFKNVVALMGTSFTTEQLEVIKKLNVKVVLNLDNDEPGKQATYTIGNELSKNGINPTVIVFDNYKDTDELIMNLGPEAFVKSYNNKINYVDFRLHYLRNNKDLGNDIDLAKYINEAISTINELDDDVLKEIKIKNLSNEFGISEEILKSKVTFGQNKVIETKIIEKPKKKYNKYNISEMRIIFLMLNHKEVIINYEKNLGFLPSEDMRKLASEIVIFKDKNNGWSYADFMSYINNKPDIMQTLNEVLANNKEEEYNTLELEDYFTIIKKYRVDKQINKLKEQIKNTLDIEEKKRLMKRIEKMKKEVLEW